MPDTADGLSLYPYMTGRKPAEERVLHIEHSPNQHALTDGKWKYIWTPGDGSEQLFDLETDRQELHDLSSDPVSKDRLAAWRDRMIERLANRPEGFVDDGRLVSGRPYDALIPS